MSTSYEQINELNEEITREYHFIDAINAETQKVIVGQEKMMERLLIGLLTKGHILLEGLPGLAKTLAVSTLSKVIHAKFQRIQFTPDLLPSDVTGTMIYNPGERTFEISKGPIFANFVLADEINRAPAKVQSALLEAMQERQVTIGGQTFKLEEPFLVMATQNPIDQEGTYPLPEAQKDRFMLHLTIDYPNRDDEQEIMRRSLSENGFPKVSPVVSVDDVLHLRKLVRKVYLDEQIENYILDIVSASRDPKSARLSEVAPFINYGASPRASISMAIAAKAVAFLNGRGFVIPEDVRDIAPDILRHRIGTTFEAEAEMVTKDDIVNKILDKIMVP